MSRFTEQIEKRACWWWLHVWLVKRMLEEYLGHGNSARGREWLVVRWVRVRIPSHTCHSLLARCWALPMTERCQTLPFYFAELVNLNLVQAKIRGRERRILNQCWRNTLCGSWRHYMLELAICVVSSGGQSLVRSLPRETPVSMSCMKKQSSHRPWYYGVLKRGHGFDPSNIQMIFSSLR